MADHAFSASRVFIVVGDRRIGWATGFRAQESFNQFPIDVLGDPYTKQHEITAVKVSGSFDTIKLNSAPITSLITQGNPVWYRQSDQSTDAHIRELIAFEPLTIDLVDMVSQAALFRIQQMRPESRVWSVAYGAVMTENLSFVCTRIIENPTPIVV